MEGIRPLNKFIQLYRDHLISAGKSWDPLRACLYDILEFHNVIGEGKDLRNVDQRRVQSYLANIQRQYGTNAAERKQESVREFYGFLQQEELMRSNPFADLRPKKKEARRG